MDRPAFSDLMLALLSNGVRTIVIEGLDRLSLDRLSRDSMIQETLIREIHRQGFEIVSTKEPDLNSTEPTRVFIRKLFGLLAELDRSQIVLKLKVARQRKKQREGRCEGRKPYGFHAGEQETLERMKALQKQGKNYEGIAKALNAASIKTRSGGLWYPATVRRILMHSSPATRTQHHVRRSLNR
jgi:DNA invertase Pin-like site-specific DNA recombinase